jgi:hypothetical protein
MREYTVHEAAERLIRCREDGKYITYSDAYKVADAYLAEHPADDGEPITADWLRSALPVTRSVFPSKDCVSFLIDCKFDIECFFGRRWVAVFSVFILEMKTRGDVRLLCRALQIDLTEPPSRVGG